MKLLIGIRSSLLILAACLLADGCAGHGDHLTLNEEAIAPNPPSFLTGAASALFTNSIGISAQLTLDRATGKPLTGTFIASGSHLLFAPKGDRTFIWDVSSHSGFVISEEMQSYAPISSPNYVTGVLTKSETAGPLGSKINGEAGHLAEVTVNLSDGSHQDFSLWRSTAWQGFPVEIKTAIPGAEGVINLTGLRHDPLKPELFQPPAGFTAYANLEAMTGEYIMRRSKVNTKGRIEHPDDEGPARVTPGAGPGR